MDLSSRSVDDGGVSESTAPHPAHIIFTDVAHERHAPLRLITLQRPAKLNCLNLAMLDELRAALPAGGTTSAVVLMGAGSSFCAGIDLSEIGGTKGANPERARFHLERLADIYRWFLTTDVPTIVLARGYAVGGGAGLAVGARTVVVAEDFRFKLPGANLAQLAAVALPLTGLRIGRPDCREFLGQELDARTALRIGLVDAVVPPTHLAELETAVQRGILAPDLPPIGTRSTSFVKHALAELDRFQQGLNPSR
jgi:enoyl-CoA hydratase